MYVKSPPMYSFLPLPASAFGSGPKDNSSWRPYLVFRFLLLFQGFFAKVAGPYHVRRECGGWAGPTAGSVEVSSPGAPNGWAPKPRALSRTSFHLCRWRGEVGPYFQSQRPPGSPGLCTAKESSGLAVSKQAPPARHLKRPPPDPSVPGPTVGSRSLGRHCSTAHLKTPCAHRRCGEGWCGGVDLTITQPIPRSTDAVSAIAHAYQVPPPKTWPNDSRCFPLSATLET